MKNFVKNILTFVLFVMICVVLFLLYYNYVPRKHTITITNPIEKAPRIKNYLEKQIRIPLSDKIDFKAMRVRYGKDILIDVVCEWHGKLKCLPFFDLKESHYHVVENKNILVLPDEWQFDLDMKNCFTIEKTEVRIFIFPLLGCSDSYRIFFIFADNHFSIEQID
jgi:hypothetical protein